MAAEMIPLTRPRQVGLRVPGMVSVTLSSRKRPEMLAASVSSLLEYAARPDLVEVLVAHDPDDQETAGTALSAGAVVVWEAPERYGYAHSARYYAALIEQARGEWLLPTWGDDGLMQTPGWDGILRGCPPGSVAWVDGNITGMTCFPAVHADVLAVTGRIPDLPALDTWFEWVARDAGVLVRPAQPVYVTQDRFDLTGRNDDVTYREGRAGYRTAEFFSDRFTGLRARDAAALRTARTLAAEYEERLSGPWTDIRDQLTLLYDAARAYPGVRVREFGVRTGESTCAFLAAAASVGGRVASSDISDPLVPLWWGHTGLFTFRRESSLDAEPAPCDVLFLDTSHSYDDTLAELRRHVPSVVPGGRVLCHDTLLDEPGFDPGAVARALDAYCAEAGLGWSELGGRYGLGQVIIPGEHHPPAPPAGGKGHAVVSYIHGGTVTGAFNASLMALGMSSRTPVDTAIVVSTGPNISGARNRVVDRFLRETTAEWLLMADTDMVFTPDALDRLIDAADPVDRPVIGGLCYGLAGDGSSVPVLFDIDESVTPQRFRRVTEWEDGEVIQVAATGAAFLLVHRDVFPRVAKAADRPGAPWFAEVPGAEYLLLIGEDTSFCLSCGLAGIAVHVHTGVKIGHIKPAMIGEVG